MVDTNRSELVERIVVLLKEDNCPDLSERIATLLDDAKRSDLIARVEALLQEIGVRTDRPGLDPDAQEILGRVSGTLSYLPRLKNAAINVAQAELAVRALLSSPPEKKFAETIAKDLKKRVNIYKNPIRSILNGRTPATFVLLGIVAHGFLLVFAVVALARLVVPCDPPRVEAAVATVCWVQMVIAGAVGGATSLITRLNELAALSRWSSEGDPLQLFYTGLLKPIVGIVVGLFAYAVFSTGFITVDVPLQGASTDLFYAALTFLAGFSERFAKDLTDAAAIVPGKE
jgi:hypothetical protein